jgi:hypothetical protein
MPGMQAVCTAPQDRVEKDTRDSSRLLGAFAQTLTIPVQDPGARKVNSEANKAVQGITGSPTERDPG